MSGADEVSRLTRVVEKVDEWPVGAVSAAVLTVNGVEASRGDGVRVFALASVTKLLVAYSALVAVEEGAIALDDPAGPEGATVRHLLAHTSGVDFSDRSRVRRAPGERRIYSSAGFEILADHIVEATGIAFPDYLRQAVCEPLGMSSTVVDGSAGHGARSSLDDLCVFAAELLSPRQVHTESLREAVTEQFPGLDGLVPGFGVQRPCPWGLGFELRAAKHPHWTGSLNSPATFGHFGQSGTFLWVDPELELAVVVLTDRDFGDWAVPAWSEFSDEVIRVATGRDREDDALGG